jgi:transforming growth factor-beta-induced protein
MSLPQSFFSARLVAALAVVLSLGLVGCDSSGTNGGGSDTPSIAQLVSSRDNLSTLGSALSAADLAETFIDESDDDNDEDGDGDNDDETEYTVFAPNNAAFAPLTVDDLTQNRTSLLSSILQYHVVEDEVLSGDLSDGQTIETLQGDELTVSIEGGNVFINGAAVVEADLEASNGVVHVVDGVLLQNRTAAERLSVTQATQTLTDAAEAAGLAGTLNGSGPFTVFAPTEEAFGRLTVDALLNNQNLLQSVLQYHVVPSEAFAGDLSDGQTLTTVQGDELTVSIDGEDVFINGAQVVEPNQDVSNGVIHQVDAALLENRTAYERLSVTQATQEVTAAIDRVGLASTLNDESATFTVFAPTDDQVPDDLSGFSDQELENILLYHVIGGSAVESGAISDGQTATTEEGSDVTFTIADDTIRVNDAPVTRPDLGVNNGVIHQIGGLLMPSSGSGSSADVTITVNNVGSSAWEVTNVDGASGIAGSGENPTLTLSTDTRYRIVNNGGSPHPFGIQEGNGDYLLAQPDDINGSYESDADVNFVSDSDGVTFTVTSALAGDASTYNCTVHGAMEGTLETN